MKKTLFVSDLDGTLLTPEETLSEYTSETINLLTKEKGLLFSYATARSYVTASKATKELCREIPAIIYNGVFIIHKDKFLLSNFFNKDDVEFIKNIVFDFNVFPIVYSFFNNKERFAYLSSYHTKGQDDFIASRNDFRKTEVNTYKELFDGDIFYFSFIGNSQKLKEIYPLVKDKFICYFQNDIYSGETWLEIMPKNATKANAALKLKEILNCNKLVVFGDGVNDKSMFEIADESYAVENADEKLKAIATGIIKSNRENGVAEFLKSKFS